MIVITAQGRLAHQPELKMLPNGGSVCEFRLLSSRFSKGAEVTEAVTFVCFGDDAERFCEGTEKGQLISATGTQETNSYKDANNQARSYVKYRMTWFQKGPRPHRGERSTEGSSFRQPPSPTQSTERHDRQPDVQAVDSSRHQSKAPSRPTDQDDFDDIEFV